MSGAPQPSADRAGGLRPEPPAGSQPKALIPCAGFMLKAWDVTVVGYGVARINAPTRGAALAQAWRSDAFNAITFGQFLKIASAWRALFVSADFGAPITVEGKPAFFVDRNRAYVRVAYPGEKHVLSAHPYDVEPERFRPEAYRAQVDTRRMAETGTGSVRSTGSAVPKGCAHD